MENEAITKLSTLDAHYAEQTVALLVDSFYDMFKGISKDRELLAKLFIATSPEFKRRGVATKLFTFIEKHTNFAWFYLDVLTSNHSAICLYEKLGYKVDTVKRSIWMRLAGIKAMNIMKKEMK